MFACKFSIHGETGNFSQQGAINCVPQWETLTAPSVKSKTLLRYYSGRLNLGIYLVMTFQCGCFGPLRLLMAVLIEFWDSGLATTRVREATAPNAVKQPSLDMSV